MFNNRYNGARVEVNVGKLDLRGGCNQSYQSVGLGDQSTGLGDQLTSG